MKKTIFLILLSLCIVFTDNTYANTGVFYGSGNQVIPIKNKQIQLVREKVDIKLTIDENSGRFGVPFIPWANVTAKFYLKNTINGTVSLQMGFPFLDLQGFGDEKYVIENLNFKVISGGKDKKTEIKEGLIEKEFDPRGLFKKVFAWQDEFGSAESKEVVVCYRMLMGVASANSNIRNFDEQGEKFSDIDNLFSALCYNFDYITKTAYTWAGHIEEAVFKFDCSAFYRELDHQDFMAELGDRPPIFSRPTFWESIHPVSAEKNGGVHQWIFKGCVPEDGLSVSFMVLFLPSIPAEVGKYYTTSLIRLEGIKAEEFKTVLYGYYQNIAFDKQPSGPFAQSYFKDVGLVKMPKMFISTQDRKNIEEIANNFEKLIKQ